jgi:hypothetical protein
VAADQALTNGKVSVNSGTLIDDSTIQNAGKSGVGMSIEGLTAGTSGTGSFGASVVNSKQATTGGVASQAQTTGYTLWTFTPTGGATLPTKWTQTDPQIQLNLIGNTVPNNLNPNDVDLAFTMAANTWGSEVAQKLFVSGTPVKIDNTKQVIPANPPQNGLGYNSEGWRQLSSSENKNGQTLAITYDYFGTTPVNGYYPILESDTAFNSARPWSTSTPVANYDVQSVILHELGHTIGLDHVSDPNQIMNPTYTGSRTLGNGDIAGGRRCYMDLLCQ